MVFLYMGFGTRRTHDLVLKHEQVTYGCMWTYSAGSCANKE